MTKNEMIEKVVSLAESQIGYEEPNHDNHNKYAKWIDSTYPPTEWYNGRKDGGDWCTIFVDYCFLYSLGYNAAYEILNRSSKYGKLAAVVHYMYQCLEEVNRVGKEPHVGDIVFYHNDKYSGLESLSHVGIVTGIEGAYIYTVEGNSGPDNTEVYKRKIRRDYDTKKWGIFGFGYPNYGGEPGPDPDPRTLDGYTVGCEYQVICRETLNVRTKPVVDESTYITEFNPGTHFICKALTRDSEGNTWMRIENPVAGWLCAIYHGDRYIGEAGPKTLDGYTVGKAYEVVAKRGLNVRKGPGKEYGITRTLSYGTKVICGDIVKRDDGNTWVLISSSGEWVAAHYEGDRYLK